MTSPHPAKPIVAPYDESSVSMHGKPIEAPVEELVGTHCVVDGNKIEIMAFKMTGVCSEYCRKVRDKEIVDARTEPV